MLAHIILSVAVLLLPPLHVQAANSADHYGGKSEGWFWYKDPKERKKIEEPPPPPPPAPPAKEAVPPEAKKPPPVPFSVEWLKANYERLQLDAIEHPDDRDKVAAFMYAQRMILDKAQNFANAAHHLANTDPLLDESNRVPLDAAAKFAVIRGQDISKKRALEHLATKGGIFFFFDSSCSFCGSQQKAIEWLAKDYGFSVKNISVDGKGLPGMDTWVTDKGQATTLGLKIMPTTVFVVPPNGYYIISQGFHAADTLGEKILMAAHTQNLIPAEFAKHIGVFERGVMTSKDMRNEELIEAAKNAEDTATWVKKLRTLYEGKY